MIISPGGFFWVFFKIMVFWFVSAIKGQKMIQNDKNFCMLRLISQESLFILRMRKRKYLLIFFQFLIFEAHSGVKGQKMTQNDRKLCVEPISQEVYTIWLWFLVHIYKMMTSSYAFSFFQNFDFLGCLGVKRPKNGPKGQNLSVSLCLRNHTSNDCGFWYTCVKWYLQQFLIFSKFWSLRFLAG